MTKLSRKLLLSVLTVAFALITLGATTFAWFTLSTKAEVQEFEVEVTAGAGIEISADGITYSNSLTAQQVYDAISRAGSSRILDHVTTSDGINFRTIESNTDFDTKAESGWVEFDLFFRSPEANVEVYLLDSSYIKSDGIMWTSDAAFDYRPDTPLLANQQRRLYAANSLRISSTEYTVTAEAGLSFEKGKEGALIYELNPDGKDIYNNDFLGNQRLDTTIKANYGAIAYYNAKNPTAQISEDTIETEEDRLPQRVLTNIKEQIELNVDGTTQQVFVSNLVNSSYLNTEHMLEIEHYDDTKIATLAARPDNDLYYYSCVTIRLWLEGWDPDMYNAVMADRIQVYLNFGGHAPGSLMSLTVDPIINLDLGENNTAELEPEVEGYDGKIIYESNDPKIATVDESGLVTAVAVGETYITVYLEDYPNVSTTVLVKVVETP